MGLFWSSEVFTIMCVRLSSQLLHLSLKKSKVTSSDTSALEMLDPFVPLLIDCLNSMHVKVLAVYGYFYPPLTLSIGHSGPFPYLRS